MPDTTTSTPTPTTVPFDLPEHFEFALYVEPPRADPQEVYYLTIGDHTDLPVRLYRAITGHESTSVHLNRAAFGLDQAAPWGTRKGWDILDDTLVRIGHIALNYSIDSAMSPIQFPNGLLITPYTYELGCRLLRLHWELNQQPTFHMEHLVKDHVMIVGDCFTWKEGSGKIPRYRIEVHCTVPGIVESCLQTGQVTGSFDPLQEQLRGLVYDVAHHALVALAKST